MHNKTLRYTLIISLLVIIATMGILYFSKLKKTSLTNNTQTKLASSHNTKKNSLILNQTPQLLPKEKAFQLEAPIISDKHITLRWNIAPGYYLYRHGFKILHNNNAPIPKLHLPKGQDKYDDYLGHFQVYENYVIATFPTTMITLPTTITAHYQGCAESGYCYPPMQKQITLHKH